MARPFNPPDYYRLDRRSSVESNALLSVSDLDEDDLVPLRRKSAQARGGLWSWCRACFRLFRRGSAGRNGRRLVALIRLVLGFLIVLVAVTGIFWPSYTHLPPHYQALRRSAAQSNISGPGNPHDEKIFVAAILYDQEGELAGGRWGNALLRLIYLLGEDNVFLSIYENDGEAKGHQALRDLERKLPCNRSIQIDPHLDLNTFPRVIAPGGAQRIKRTNYLAELRNRALRPLDEHPEIKYDRILYLNDVIFDPIDVLHLLFSTNSDQNGVAQYRAACAVDFSNPFKFYDTYATRDLDGYGIGLQFFPWYTTAGSGQSRRDMLGGKDAVRVRSCWGGMVAFDAKYFQRRDNPVRFRADPDVFFDGSESCIIHADIQDPPSNDKEVHDSGIYMNPFVRVAYTERTYSWLWLTRRFEKLYSIPHNLASQVAGFPRANPRRSETPGQVIKETLWVPDATDTRGGAFREVDRVAGNDGFCADGFGGYRGLQVIVEDRKPGQGGWEEIPLPLN
ncbi:hypothetical protein BO94DRAFT_528673 [Aspergillus sclerotioniger CBS 115572]|uniref:Glycosyltransferase family 69 protein n=1 Tax=Aspergillus sclerotioniger CBS 115572 TaxID=1450535 RepID=A0A317UWW9_9EURO|nr:hypothetical protein BO94DRAFT_528673 [Aspergillus sclerotioniger CBS 115572]PWY66513.1 hypothetical protein BO94DRAFT_528673 [Aspergillus sclerotioniger CBS 115572]